ncbi:Trypsin [Amycolatopsis arida]|uniref:Trypsin n=1 Tax=Amycolatopsis arida TaxID=587909 RepID=A0A1I5KKC7_9PSEU|nr:serine protease [Amycolatopsis arida]TDX97092.1 trypsin [Amycolatopsis arida]SFO85508.1 Trypsin [Amycolatopsis arida]
MPERYRRRIAAALALLAGAAFAPASAGTAVGAQPFIVGGSEVSIRDHPYAVYLADRQDAQFCGGVLVSPDAVVTAAHCAKAVDPSDLRVVGGRQDKRSRDGRQSAVNDIWVAPGYRDPGSGGDLAVLRLNERMPYRSARVAGAGDRSLYAEGTKATVLGWGRTSDGGPRSNTLRGAQVPVISDEGCRKAFGNYDARTMLCAGYPDGGIDACQGDSGGPLLVGNTVIGIVSWGEGCAQAGKPGVYTRLSTYSDEIAKRIRG